MITQAEVCAQAYQIACSRMGNGADVVEMATRTIDRRFLDLHAEIAAVVAAMDKGKPLAKELLQSTLRRSEALSRDLRLALK